MNKPQQDIADRVSALAKGSAGNYEAYREQVGYISALNDVLDKCREIELNIYGNKSKPETE